MLNPQFEHCEVTSGFLNIPQLDELRKNAREFRSVNISQLLEHKLAFNDLVKEIIESAQGAEAVFLPACFGLVMQLSSHYLNCQRCHHHYSVCVNVFNYAVNLNPLAV